jgi:hypothetical protein
MTAMSPKSALLMLGVNDDNEPTQHWKNPCLTTTMAMSPSWAILMLDVDDSNEPKIGRINT